MQGGIDYSRADKGRGEGWESLQLRGWGEQIELLMMVFGIYLCFYDGCIIM